jgi:hypothetical protein
MRGVVGSAVLALALSTAATSHAKASIQAQLLFSGAYNSNILNVPADATPGPQGDFQFELRPSLILTTGVPRAVQRLAYLFDLFVFAKNGDADSYTHRVEWGGVFLPSKTTQMLLFAAFNEGRLNTFTLTQSSATQPVLVTPPGGVTFIGGQTTETFAWDVTALWRLTQSLAFSGYWPLDPRTSPDTYTLDSHVIPERVFQYDAIGLDLRNNYVLYSQLVAPDGTVTAQQQTLLNSLTARWRHDFGHFWNSELTAGLIEGNVLGADGPSVWMPTGLAAIRYLHPYAQVDLSYAHTVQPNPLVAQTFELDQVALRGGLPLGLKTHLWLSAAVAYQYAKELDFLNGTTVGRAQVVAVDGTLIWAPRTEIQLFARYQYADQIGYAQDPLPLPSYTRQVGLIGMIVTYPGDPAAVVPNRQALRVDRTDVVGIPEPHSRPQLQ